MKRCFSLPVLQVNSSLPFTMLQISYANSEIRFFTCGPEKEERRLILGALIQNRKKKLQSETLQYPDRIVIDVSYDTRGIRVGFVPPSIRIYVDCTEVNLIQPPYDIPGTRYITRKDNTPPPRRCSSRLLIVGLRKRLGA